MPADPNTSPAPAPRQRARAETVAPHQRKFSNFLVNKELQLRYVLVVTMISVVIAGVLGYMVYRQVHQASAITNQNYAIFGAQMQAQTAADLAANDRALIFKILKVAIGLSVVLSAFLLIMTHKVAGPLYKVSMYFDRMAVGRLGVVTPLRQGDMLQDFYLNFKDMHDAVRARAQADASALEKALESLRDSKNQADYRGEARAQFDEALDELEKHLTERKKQLA